MIEDFGYYLESGAIRKQVVDTDHAESLMKKAERRLSFIRSQSIDEESSSFIFEEIYECIREAIQSLMSLRGFKPYSHEAVISFIKEFYDFEESIISTLDRYRILRNKSVYGAKKISVAICMQAMDFLTGMIPKLRAEIDKGK